MELYVTSDSGVKYLNWPGLLQLGGGVVGLFYYAWNPRALLNVNIFHVFGHVGIAVSYAVIAGMLKMRFFPNKDDGKNVADLISAVKDIPFYSLFFMTFGEDALFLPAYTMNNLWIKPLACTVFGLIHYLCGSYSLSCALVKIPSTYLLLSYHKHLINFSLGHWLVDYLSFKVAARIMTLPVKSS